MAKTRSITIEEIRKHLGEELERATVNVVDKLEDELVELEQAIRADERQKMIAQLSQPNATPEVEFPDTPALRVKRVLQEAYPNTLARQGIIARAQIAQGQFKAVLAANPKWLDTVGRGSKTRYRYRAIGI